MSQPAPEPNELLEEALRTPCPWWYTRPLMVIPAQMILQKRQTGVDVKHVQRALGAPLTGVYDEATAQRVSGVQQAFGLKVSGSVDSKTAKCIEWMSGTCKER